MAAMRGTSTNCRFFLATWHNVTAMLHLLLPNAILVPAEQSWEWMFYYFLNHSSVDRISCFPVADNPKMNTFVYVTSLSIDFLRSVEGLSGITESKIKNLYLGQGLLCIYVAKLISKRVTPVKTPTNSVACPTLL